MSAQSHDQEVKLLEEDCLEFGVQGRQVGQPTDLGPNLNDICRITTGV